MAARIKTGDTVMVIAGDDKGRTGKVLRVFPDDNRVLVEGVNRHWKNVRPTQQNPKGERRQIDVPLNLSNVMLVDPSNNQPTRVRFEMKDGKKHRVAVKSGTDLGAI